MVEATHHCPRQQETGTEVNQKEGFHRQMVLNPEFPSYRRAQDGRDALEASKRRNEGLGVGRGCRASELFEAEILV